MRIYAVRNVDGQLGIVAASSKEEAVERLDEFASFEGCPIRELPELMLLLDVDDEGEITLEQIGEEMDEAVRTFAYPLVKQALAEVMDQEESGERDPIDPYERVPAQNERIRKAIDAERERVRRKKTAEPRTERGREVERYLDLPASFVRHQERATAQVILDRKDVPKDPRKRHWRPRCEHPPLRVVYLSGAALRDGVEEHVVGGVRVRVFGAAKTVADCFKYRNKIGTDVAIEALREYRRVHPKRLEAVWHFAEVDRVARVIRPYLETIG